MQIVAVLAVDEYLAAWVVWGMRGRCSEYVWSLWRKVINEQVLVIADRQSREGRASAPVMKLDETLSIVSSYSLGGRCARAPCYFLHLFRELGSFRLLSFCLLKFNWYHFAYSRNDLLMFQSNLLFVQLLWPLTINFEGCIKGYSWYGLILWTGTSWQRLMSLTVFDGDKWYKNCYVPLREFTFNHRLYYNSERCTIIDLPRLQVRD